MLRPPDTLPRDFNTWMTDTRPKKRKFRIDLSSSHYKTYVWLFKPDPRQWRKLYLEGFTGKSCPPHASLGHSQCIAVWGQYTQAPLGSCSWHICILSPSGFISWSLNWGLEQVFFRHPCWGLLARRTKDLEDTFPHPDSIPTTFLLLALTPPGSPISGSIKLQEPLAQHC